jgi:hypothetical protein
LDHFQVLFLSDNLQASKAKQLYIIEYPVHNFDIVSYSLSKIHLLKACKTNLNFTPSFTGAMQFSLDLKACKRMLNRTSMFNGALYFWVALRASKK